MSSAGIAAAPSAEQSAVIESWGRGQAVLAGAGCGKTTTLVAKCAALLARSPDARFAAVSFTEKSAGDLRKKLALGLPRREDGPPLGPHWVMTIHGLCRSVIREFPTEAEIDGEETLLDEAESRRLWEQVLDGLWFEPLPEGVDADIEKLLERQSRADLEKLLDRMRDLSAFGAAERLAGEGSRAEALLRVHSHAEERYLRLKRKRGALDFGDLEARARIALTHAHVRRAYHTRFELVLVDEFQDTNPVQAEILWAFSRPDQSNLCVVGDPKQSIYRFRDADVTVFEDLCAKLPLRQSLTGNYRCRPGIIDVTNAVCAPAFEASNLGYEPLRAARPAAGEGGLEPVLRLDLRGPADLADWVAAEVTAGRPLEDMALLLKRVRGAEKWLRPLAAKGVPLALGSGGLFWDDPRVRELTAMLRWWDQPGQTLAGAAFLRAPWVAIPDATLDEWIRPNRGQELAKRFFESTHPLAARLAPLWNGSTRPGELVMAVLEDPRAEAELGAAGLGLWHRAEELSSKGLDAAAVVREMVRASDERNRERDVPPPRNQGQLQVLTLHGAKGLEFKRVILVDFEGKARAQAMPEVYWDRKTGAYLAARDEGGNRVPKDPGEAPWRAREQGARLAESKRLFYVAVTRAQEQLVLACVPVARDIPPAPEAFDQDHWRAWIESAPGSLSTALAAPWTAPRVTPRSPVSTGAALAETGARPAAAPVLWRRARHSVTEWTLLERCARAYDWRYLHPAPESPADQIFASNEGAADAGAADLGLSAREIGTRVHACLEHRHWDGLVELERETGGVFRAGPVVQWARSSPLMAPPDLLTESHSELAFEIPVDGEVLVGAMDRLVLEKGGAGKWASAHVIDFKVAKAGRSAEDLLEAYTPQMELYAWATTRLLGLAPERMRATLVHLSTAGVKEVSVPLSAWVREASGVPAPLRRRIDAVRALCASGSEPHDPLKVKATPGPHCGVCEFRLRCPDVRP